MHVSDAYVPEISGRNFFKGRRMWKIYFSEKWQMVISVKIWNFSRSRMTKRTPPLESSRKI